MTTDRMHDGAPGGAAMLQVLVRDAGMIETFASGICFNCLKSALDHCPYIEEYIQMGEYVCALFVLPGNW